jgi:hypothetical protein
MFINREGGWQANGLSDLQVNGGDVRITEVCAPDAVNALISNGKFIASSLAGSEV